MKEKSSLASTQPQKREFSVNLKHKILESGDCKLWIPLPQSTPYQYLTSNILWSGNYTISYISNTQIPMLFAEFQGIKNPTLEINFNITTLERTTNLEEVEVKFNPKEKIPQEV